MHAIPTFPVDAKGMERRRQILRKVAIMIGLLEEIIGLIFAFNGDLVLESIKSGK
jgi:hypothetical protein